MRQQATLREWSPEKKWNPFNSYKLLSQVYRWRLIQRPGPVPQPALVTVDPVNACNLSCTWCNAGQILENRKGMIADHALDELARGLAEWQGHPQWQKGVEAVCIAGGGEPLLHPGVGRFIRTLTDAGIEVGVVTNGTRIHEFIEELSLCTWVGVSVDAGSPETFAQLKGKDRFARVCENIRTLTDHIAKHDCTLGTNRPGYGVSYKYLLYNGNISDVHVAAQTARELGCRNFHLRPAGIAWYRLGEGNKSIFTAVDRMRLSEQLEKARSLESEDFSVFGITHKFDDSLNKANQFSTCHAVFMTCVFMPPRQDRGEEFCLSLCCDRRGDPRLEFQAPMKSFADVEAHWGGEQHWAMHDAIELDHCPRCTYQPHNQIFEHVILNDSMTYKFI